MTLTKSLRLFLSITFIGLTSCTSTPPAEDAQTQTTTDSEPVLVDKKLVVGTTNGDTLNVGGKMVAFFAPAKASDSKSPITNEALEGFKKTSAMIMDSMKAYKDITTMYTTASVFRIISADGSAMIVGKSAMHVDAGMMLNDGGQPPTFKKNILPAKEYMKSIKSYFFLK